MSNLKPHNIPQLADDCLRLLCKATKYDIFVEKLRRALSGSFGSAVRPAVFEIIEKLTVGANGDSPVSDADIDKISPMIDKLLGEDLAETIKEDLEKLTKNVYNEQYRIKGQDIASGESAAKQELSGKARSVAASTDINYNLSLPDKRAISQLQRANIVWVKGNDLKTQVANDLTAEMVKARELGLTRSQTAKILERQFGPLVPKDIAEKYGTARYWDGFARQHATRTRVFADLDTYAAAGITHFQNWSRLSERTCETCGRMHATVYAVKDALKQKEAYFTAAQNNDIDGMKKAFPWLYAPPAENDLPKDVRLAPLHYFCECTTKIFREEPGVSSSATGEVNLVDSGKKVKFVNRLAPDDVPVKDKTISRKVAYTTLDAYNKNIFVTEEAIEHCKERIADGDHKKFGEIDQDGYKNIAEALADPAHLIKQGEQRLVYIGKNGYVVPVHENQVWTAYFGNIDNPKTLKEAIENTKNNMLRKKGVKLL